jgi:hypothetical protein
MGSKWEHHVTSVCLGTVASSCRSCLCLIHLGSYISHPDHDNDDLATLPGLHPRPLDPQSAARVSPSQNRRDDPRNPFPHARYPTRCGLPPHAAPSRPHASPLGGKSRRDTSGGEHKAKSPLSLFTSHRSPIAHQPSSLIPHPSLYSFTAQPSPSPLLCPSPLPARMPHSASQC